MGLYTLTGSSYSGDLVRFIYPWILLLEVHVSVINEPDKVVVGCFMMLYVSLELLGHVVQVHFCTRALHILGNFQIQEQQNTLKQHL